MSKLICYYLQTYRFIFSSENPKNIFQKGKYCRFSLEVLLVVGGMFGVAVGVFCAIFATFYLGYMTTFLMYRDSYNIKNGCPLSTRALNNANSLRCARNEELYCYYNYSTFYALMTSHEEGSNGCIGIGILCLITIILFLCFLFLIYKCTSEVTESIESAYELTEICIEKDIKRKQK